MPEISRFFGIVISMFYNDHPPPHFHERLPLRDPDRFREVSVNSELGTIVWPNGADLDPDVLYAMVTGEEIDVPDRSSAA